MPSRRKSSVPKRKSSASKRKSSASKSSASKSSASKSSASKRSPRRKSAAAAGAHPLGALLRKLKAEALWLKKQTWKRAPTAKQLYRAYNYSVWVILLSVIIANIRHSEPDIGDPETITHGPWAQQRMEMWTALGRTHPRPPGGINQPPEGMPPLQQTIPLFLRNDSEA